jgi:CheY-like chemotaxis protein
MTTKGKVLIIDDDPDFVEVVRTALEADDFEVFSAADQTGAAPRIAGIDQPHIEEEVIYPGSQLLSACPENSGPDSHARFCQRRGNRLC